jgi:hypothetical protein
MSQKVLGGKPYKRYPDPNVSNLPNEYGLYPWSVLYAHLSYIDGAGAVQNTGGITNLAAVTARMLLFMSDIPVLGQMKCYHTDATNSPRLNDLRNEVSAPFLVTTIGGATAVTVDIGEVAVGYTGPSRAVFCTGFPASSLFKVAGNNAQTTDEAAALVWANGATLNGPVSQNKDEGSTLVPQPIILWAEQYGPDFLGVGNNIFTDTAGKIWLIVGLHDVEQPAPP